MYKRQSLGSACAVTLALESVATELKAEKLSNDETEVCETSVWAKTTGFLSRRVDDTLRGEADATPGAIAISSGRPLFNH